MTSLSFCPELLPCGRKTSHCVNSSFRGGAGKLDANPELLNGRPHTVFKVWPELSSGHKWRVLSDPEAGRTIKSQFISPCVNRERLIVRDRKSETTGAICIKWVNMSVWKVQFIPVLFTFILFFLLHREPHTNMGSIFIQIRLKHTHAHAHKRARTSLSFSLVCYQWEPSCCQTHSVCTVKASPVKLLKWHYSGQFFSLYLKCLNVWQTNQRSDPARHLLCGRSNRYYRPVLKGWVIDPWFTTIKKDIPILKAMFGSLLLCPVLTGEQVPL